MATTRICSIADCGKPVAGRGWCTAHWTRWRRHGDPLGSAPAVPKEVLICSIPQCGKVVLAREWCENHYQRWRKYNDPLGGGPDRNAKGAARKFIEEVILHYEGDECLLWPFSKTKGYGIFHADGKKQIVSRYVCYRTHGNPPTAKHQAAHSCGNGSGGCVTKGHLSWKTGTENQADRIVHGTSNRGERHGRSKLTEQQVREIRSMIGTQSHSAIAKRFGVVSTHIGLIARRGTWTHVG